MAVTRGKICDTRCQSFYNEVIRNEDNLRIKWFIKNREKLKANLQDLKHPTKRKITPEVEKTEYKYVEPLPSWNPPETNQSVDISIMKPIEPETKDILYQEKIESFENTKKYLLQRWEKKPEDRFYFPDCTNWMYGWRLKDYPPVPPTSVGIKSVLRDQLYHRTEYNLRRNPDWYCDNRIKNPQDYQQLQL